MTRQQSIEFDLQSLRREQDSVETQVSWFIDNRTPEELLSDPEYQELEALAFDLFYKERDLCREIEREEFLAHEARLVSV